ncbi:proteophosphoglycan 5 [Ceratobasidium sp. AG-Ba]|nr:proteophosphoglycan 5 [Ceratobasidium sp. AG-Ba]
MTIAESSVGEDWIASPSSLALSLARSPVSAPSVAEVLPPGLDQPAGRIPSPSTLVRSTSVSSVDTVSSFSDVSPPQLLAPSIPEEGSSLYRSDSISSVGTLDRFRPASSPCPPSPSSQLYASQPVGLFCWVSFGFGHPSATLCASPSQARLSGVVLFLRAIHLRLSAVDPKHPSSACA